MRRETAKRLALEHSGLNFIDGETRIVPETNCFQVINPATGEEIGVAPQSSSEDVDFAVQSAAAAFESWAEMAPLERSRLLLDAVSNLEAVLEDLALLIALETGRPIRTETRPEVANAVKIFRYFAGLALESKGDAFLYTSDVLAVTVREPLGVVAAIVPWNVPAMLFCLKAAPALTTGNTVVVKPAEESALSTMLLARALAKSLPPGVLNVVNGFGEQAGQKLIGHSEVKKVTFTGSVDVGRTISEQVARRMIPVTLELGGKSPIIVFPDADLEDAAQATITGMRFSRQGQSCTSTTRILVHSAIKEDFLAVLAKAVGRMQLGDPLDEETDIGSLISQGQMERVATYVKEAADDGVEVRELNVIDPGLRKGSYYPATLVLDPPTGSKVVQEEIFGPVATVHSWAELDEAAALANDTEFGLSACIITDSSRNAFTLARKLEAGFIQVNSGMVIQPGLSFGGYKSSGLGREASLDSMLDAYTQVKTIIVDHGDEVR
jgi:acyl-CoA reductase-like NAD-dependent aldehyde dehydrogenase